jgi:hypothetical protein
MTRQVVCLHHFAFPDRDQPPEQAKPCGSSPNLPTNCGSRDTWEHCFALLSPSRAAVLEDLQARVGRLHFAGDWTSPSAGVHGALGESSRVAAAVLRECRDRPATRDS